MTLLLSVEDSEYLHFRRCDTIDDHERRSWNHHLKRPRSHASPAGLRKGSKPRDGTLDTVNDFAGSGLIVGRDVLTNSPQ
jgi:hypothetical protein